MPLNAKMSQVEQAAAVHVQKSGVGGGLSVLDGRGIPVSSKNVGVTRTAELQAKLQSINTRLEQLGASEDFCKTYFDSGAGVCVEEFGGVCVDHRCTQFALPKHLMCATKYRRKFQYLKKRLEIVEAERKKLKEQWTDFRQKHEMVESMLANNEKGQQMVKEKRAQLQSQISHQLGEHRKLQGELYRFLSGVRPIDASSFHDEVVSCMLSKTKILEELVLGPVGQPLP